MKTIMLKECYKLCHSRKIRWIVLLLLVMTWLMYSMSIGWKKEIVYVWLDGTEAEQEAFMEVIGEFSQDIVDLIGVGHNDYNAGNPGHLWLTPKALALFEEGGPLWEKYHQYHFPERMVLQQMVGGEIAPPEQEDFEPGWRFHKMLTDYSAASYTAILFTALFFGMDFTTRGYQGALFAGQRRKKLFWGKYMIFFLLFMLLSLAELMLAITIYIPKIWLLPASYLVRGLLFRCLVDTGRAILFVPLSFLGKSEWKAVGLTFLIAFLFMSNLFVINIDPYQVLSEGYWESCREIGSTLKIIITTTVIFVGAGLLSAELFQRTELK